LEAITAIIELISSSEIKISNVYTVGGFSANPFVIGQLKDQLGSLGITVHCPDGHTAKAAADGAVLFYIDQYVSSRVARMTYGVPVNWNCDDPRCSSVGSARTPMKLPSGAMVFSAGFRSLLLQGTVISKEKEFRCSLYKEVLSVEDASFVSMDLLAYRGYGPPPDWVDEPGTRHLFNRLCTISAFLPPSKALIRSNEKRKTEKFWRVCCDFVIRFGGTEMKAQIVWFENDTEFRSSAEIIYEDAPDTYIIENHIDDQIGMIPARDGESAALLSHS